MTISECRGGSIVYFVQFKFADTLIIETVAGPDIIFILIRFSRLSYRGGGHQDILSHYKLIPSDTLNKGNLEAVSNIILILIKLLGCL